MRRKIALGIVLFAVGMFALVHGRAPRRVLAFTAAAVAGDVNGDGRFDAVDVDLALRALLTGDASLLAHPQLADVAPLHSSDPRGYGDGAIHSDDIETRPSCGSRGPQAVTDLVPPVQEALKTMKNGDVANPIRYGTEAVLIVQLVKESKIPTYEEVKDQMAERAYGEAMERQRKLWLLELRRGVYVDVRL